MEIYADPLKPYTLTFRNGTTTLNKSFTNDQYGSTSLDVDIPQVQGTWEIVYNGIVVQTFVFDNVAPTLKSVSYNNLNNQNAILPFVKKGDQVEYQFESSEGLWESELLTDTITNVDAPKILVNSTCTDTLSMKYELSTAICNADWRTTVKHKVQFMVTNYLNTVTGQDGRVRAEFSLTDFAGNKIIYKNPTTVINYSTTPKPATVADWNLYADTIAPDAPGWNTTGWGDGVDGVNADGIKPEKDRISTYKMVIRGNSFVLSGRGEKYARMIIRVNGVDSPILTPTNTNCATGTNTVVNGMIVKFAELCDLNYNYTFTGNGAQDIVGEPTDQTNFSIIQLDLSGNYSISGNTNLTVYNDRTPSSAPNVNLDSPDTTKPVVDGNITRSFQVRAVEIGERMSDVVTTITSPKNVVSTRTTRQGQNSNSIGGITQIYLQNCTGTPSVCIATTNVDNSRAETIFNLGAAANDVNFTMQGDRRVGTDDDGVYKISTKNVDTSGNLGAETIKTIERDTMPPDKPSVTPVPDEDNFSVVLKVTGEAGTTAVISGASSNEGPVANPVQGIWKGNYVYSGTYVWNVTLRDRAGNMSAPVSVSYTTKAAPILTSYSLSDSTCKITDPTKLLLPFTGPHDLNSGWGPRELDPFHYGYDYNLAYGERVLAAGAGTVKKASWDPYGGGNMVTIDHGNGIVTWYAHLSQMLAKVGDNVVSGTEIGRSGNSGNVTGPHLHFQVQLNGVAQNPAGFMYNCDQKPKPDLKEKVEDTPAAFLGKAGDPWNSKTYADIVLVSQITNVIDIYTDVNGNITSSSVSDTKSYISYEDDQPDKIIIYGFATPKNSTWTYRIHRKLPSNVCVVSSTSCESEIITEKRVENSTATIEVNLIDKNEPMYNTAQKPKSIGTVTNLDSSGRWSITFNKVSEGVYKNPGSPNSLVIGQGFSLATVKTITYNTGEFSTNLPSWYHVDDTKSNMKAISPEYHYTSIDQNLYVTGSWQKSRDAYYSDTYLDTRIVKLIPVGNIPSFPNKINIVTHGLVPNRPLSTTRFDLKNLDKQDDSWVNWMNSNVKLQAQVNGTLKYIVNTDSEMAAQIANQQSTYDPAALNLFLSWKDASIDLSNNWFKPDTSAQPTEASKWIVSVAEQITNQLQNIQTDTHALPEVNCTGHSLGSLLCNEIGVQLRHTNLTPKKLVALDPPSERLTKYNLDGRPGRTKNIDTANYFWNSSNWTSSNSNRSFDFSTAYSGSGSFCGNEDLAKSAQINVSIKFSDLSEQGDAAAGCKIHGNVYANFLRIVNNSDKVVNFTDMDSKTLWNIDKTTFDKYSKRQNILDKSDVDFVIIEGGDSSSGNQKMLYIVRRSLNDNNIVYGTDNDDNINLVTNKLYSAKIYNGMGADTFTFPVLYDLLGKYEIVNFDSNSGDKKITNY